MTRLSEIQGHIASMDELLDIVGAMRSLAGMRVQEAQHALQGIRSYTDSMAAAIASALRLMPQPLTQAHHERGCRAVILCTAEHGFVGGFNERLLEEAKRTLRPGDLLFVLGSRGAALASERGCEANWTRPMATHLAGAPDVVNAVTTELYARIARGEIARVEGLFSQYRQGAASTIEHRLLLPFDTERLAAEQSGQVPLHNLAPRSLLEKLMAECVFALLTEAAVESIASENAARFAAMDSAHDNVSKKLEGLQENARAARQTEITSELLDLITGVEALKGSSKRAI
ncbi:MAG: F0F1 ATP synthase subunit gamma [Alphaproteobacteria bacterium]|nr:F0F1 ATP synthase subunit gamma [Alphaproteobacteria bacterium]